MPHSSVEMKESKKFTQTVLDPFIPGGFVDKWIRFFEGTSPDVLKNNPLQVKIVGTLLLNAATKLYLIDYNLPPATLFLILIGDPKTGKGTIRKRVMEVVKDANAIAMAKGDEPFIKIIGDTTTAALREQVANKLWLKKKREWKDLGPAGIVIQLWERADSMIGNKYMADLPEVLDTLYYGGTVMQKRVTEMATYVAEEGTYYFSLIWDTLPPYWGKLLRFLRGEYGFLRRVLPLKLTGRLPRFKGRRKATAEAAEARVWLAKFFYYMRDTGFAVELPEMPEMEDEVEALRLSDDYKDMLADYVKKLTASTILDHVLARLVTRLQGPPDPSLFNRSFRILDGVTCVTKLTSSNFCNLVTRTVELVTGSDLTSVTSVTRIARSWLYALLSCIQKTTIHDADLYEKIEKTKKLFREKQKDILTRKEWWLGVLGGGHSRKEVLEYLRALEELGVVRLWVKGRAMYVVAPWARCCINCKHLVEDPRTKTYYCDLERLDEVKYDLLKACSNFEPRGEEE